MRQISRPKQMRRIIKLSLLVLAAIAQLACVGTPESRVRAKSERRPTVAVVRAERRDLASGAELAAEFRPYQEVDLHAKVAGYLKSIHVDVGDRVRQGQLIAVLEVPEYGEELAQASATAKRSELDVVRAQSEVTRAQTALDLRKLSYERLLGVSKVKPGLIAQHEIDTAASRFREAEAQLQTAKAGLASTEQQVAVTAAGRSRIRTMIGYLRITAPFSGMITRRYADAGAMIQAGTASQTQAMPVVRLSQTDTLRLVLPVPESLISGVRVGTAVEVRVDALKRVFQGKVSRFTGRLDSATRTMETEVDLKNPGGVILPGMYGYASILIDSREKAVAVPVQAIAGHGAEPTVLVVNGDFKLEERKITTGLETPDLVEVTRGVAESEMVVVGNRTGLKTGLRVEVRNLQTSAVKGQH